jgi:tetratricopeptide (TPR) repeat protein
MSFVRISVWGRRVAAACLTATILCCFAEGQAAQNQSQKKGSAAAASPDRARQVLIANARALESRGRPDMAIQLWQQILLSDPNNLEALAGIARDYKLTGATKEGAAALDKLRQVNPNDPNISKIEGLSSNRAQSDQLRKAGDLARQGKNDDAMSIYRELYGDRPPDGDIALGYYQTLYGTASGKAQAIAAMRALSQRNPGDRRYAVALGRMLTYDAGTRAEGIRILQQHPQDADARSALRQALVWDAANPNSAAQLREYMKLHPQDTEMAAHLKENEQKLAQMNSGIARTPEERAAFAALNAHHLEEAERRFRALLDKNPANGRASAGMGFLRMQQNNFGGAVSFFTLAQQNGYDAASVRTALATSRFWFTMGEASQSYNAGQLDNAAAKYREALAMRPRSPEALNGLAGLYVKAQQYAQAEAVYEQLLKIEPRNVDAWRGLFVAYARDGQNEKALAVANQFPPAVKTAVNRDPDYLGTLARIYKAQGRTEDAQRVLSQALALPFPEGGAKLKDDTRLQYAGILMEAHRFSQAAAMYGQILEDDPSNLSAWMGLVSAHHQLNQDAQAIADVEKMPPATYESALNDTGFLSMLAAIYQQNNQFDIAQNLLERSAKLQAAGGGQASLQSQLQLAGIYLQRNNTDQAYALYRQILTAHPDRVEAWKGLIATLQATNHTNEALQQLAYIPPAVRAQLETDPQFIQAVASIYAATGDLPHATQYMQKVQQYYARIGQAMPADMAIQNAWLLYNTKNDRALYPALMRLGSRQDLTIAQREAIQTIWASWAVQRAGVAMDLGENDRAVEILEAAALAFPENVEVHRILAGGYLKTGRAKEALNIYKQLPMDNAGVPEYQGAIGAALGANDKNAAEIYLRQALQRFPNDYHILGLAARFEQARGDNQRAADYWKAAIASMPANTPTDKLAHELAYPDVNPKTHRAMTAADLQRLLDPAYAAANDPFPKTVKLPPLPSYGPDPYLGKAPVIPNEQPNTIARQTDIPTAPATTTIEEPLPQEPDLRHAVPQPQSTAPANTSTPLPNDSGTTNHHRRHGSKSSAQPGDPGYQGRMNLPATDENVTTTEPVQGTVPAQQPVFIPVPQTTVPATQPQLSLPWNPPVTNAPQQNQPAGQPLNSAPINSPPFNPEPVIPASPRQGVPPAVIPPPQASLSDRKPDIRTGLRLSAEPTGDKAATTQAQFADQTDAQLTQGSASQVRNIENVPVLPPSQLVVQSTDVARATEQPPTFSGVQYTPSAQEAATGAYSAQHPQPQNNQVQTNQPQSQSQVQGQVKQTPLSQPTPQQAQQPAAPKQAKPKRPAAKRERVPTLVTAPGEQPQAPAVAAEPQTQAQQPAAQQPDAGISDQELQDRSLPPLRGPWVKVRREPQPISPRDEAELALRSLESSYSAWLGGTGLMNYRSGDLGYDRLAALESPFEIATPLGYNARLSFIAKPVFLDSGQADGTSIIRVQESTTAGRELVNIPQPLGTEVNTGPVAGSSSTPTIPPQQNASGIAGEVQLAFPNLSFAVGTTPYGFLVRDITGRAQWRPGNGPFTFSFVRDSVKDTQLSYAGLRDPGNASLSFPGSIWGGVIATQGNMQFARGDAMSGYYFGVGGQYLSGFQVKDNTRFDGTGGAYWRVKALPEYGNLSIGVNFFAMHYSNRQDAFTYGMGGYFSPQSYFLANVPFTWAAHQGTRLHYEILGGFGVQAFQEDVTPLFPLPGQKASEVGLNNAALPALTSVGPNYNLRANGAYQITPHWFAGGFVTANNARNYQAASVGFSIHYMFRAQPSTVTAPTGMFPTDGLRPFTVP